MTDAEISKTLSHALRHEPWLYELELDDEGWASLEAVLVALRVQREDWRSLSRTDLKRVIESSSKRRHEISGERIRALYGHSVPGKLRRELAMPPRVLFHATSPDAANVIVQDGLKPMARQYVHLSADTATAWEVGRRKSRRRCSLRSRPEKRTRRACRFTRGTRRSGSRTTCPRAS